MIPRSIKILRGAKTKTKKVTKLSSEYGKILTVILAQILRRELVTGMESKLIPNYN